MMLSHKIRLNPTVAQEKYFRQAAGTSRFVWNWALAEWNRQYVLGLKPTSNTIKVQFNAVKYELFPWLTDMNRDTHSQPFTNLRKAWSIFFTDIKKGKRANVPKFKKKGRCRDSFYLANDQFVLDNKTIRIPKLGWVVISEKLRFDGKIMSGTVSRIVDKWYISIQVDVPEEQAKLPRVEDNIVGIDLGIKTVVTLSTGESFQHPKPLKKALRRLKTRQRKISKKIESAKVKAGLNPKQSIPKGTKLSLSNNRKKAQESIARLYARISNVRKDFLHKITTSVCRENQTIIIEDLKVKEMLANNKLAREISDIGFGEFRRKLTYKVLRYGNELVIADRWFPSSKLCSICGWKNDSLTLKDREWVCQECGTIHDRDLNAAINLRKLPVASS